MKNKKLLKKQIIIIFMIILLFLVFNFSMYMIFTQRLSNNFSKSNQPKMIDLENYLPFQNNSNIVKINSSLKLEKNLPILDGATALVPVYSSFIENVYPKNSVTYEGGVFSDNNTYGENFADDSKMQYNNTVRGYKAIVDGKTDILFCATPSDEQKQYAIEKGITLEYVPIGLEAFVFFVNEKNPVNNLTTDQIKDIYLGKYKNWAEVGGSNRIINPVTRYPGSGSQSAMDKFMGNKKIAKKSIFAITGGSIGFSFRYYIDGIVGEKSVKMLSLNGIYPSAENIQNGSYPIIANFYAIYRSDNKNKNIPILINWILSNEGQQIIEKSGYIPIN